ncbi:hypothetical protein HMPREF9946_00055 [Acetobacteraceae bacterium AT-5844]|nr:hypothetical protein HMPREF9946_00055 [Acetobacteraceae bacterium AT-5844]
MLRRFSPSVLLSLSSAGALLAAEWRGETGARWRLLRRAWL